MAKDFSLTTYPWSYQAKYTAEGKWEEAFIEKPHLSLEQEANLKKEAYNELLNKRNCFDNMPLVNHSTQYGLGCFEGMKAYPFKDGSVKIFRPDENGKRFAKSMTGLRMPTMDVNQFVNACKEMIRLNKEIGFFIKYNSDWEKDNYLSGHAVYMRPFTYSEPAIGLGISQYPWIVIVGTPVGSYFKPGSKKAVTTNMTRATPFGTGCIKCNANYVIPILAKKKAEDEGFMEAIFLDPKEHHYVEEGSSCNIFFVKKDGTLVTPELGDTILPGITRKSVIQLAKDKGIKVEERKISIDEVLSETVESFVTGTAAGISHFESITHEGKTVKYSDGEITPIALELLLELKGIQYGAIEDRHGWMVDVEK